MQLSSSNPHRFVRILWSWKGKHHLGQPHLKRISHSCLHAVFRVGTSVCSCHPADDSLHLNLFSEDSPPGTGVPRATYNFYTGRLIALGKGGVICARNASDRFLLSARPLNQNWWAGLHALVCTTESVFGCLLHAHLSKRTTLTPAGAMRHLLFECTQVECKVCALALSKNTEQSTVRLKAWLFPFSDPFCFENCRVDSCRLLSSQVSFRLFVHVHMCVCVRGCASQPNSLAQAKKSSAPSVRVAMRLYPLLGEL